MARNASAVLRAVSAPLSTLFKVPAAVGPNVNAKGTLVVVVQAVSVLLKRAWLPSAHVSVRKGTCKLCAI